MFINGFSSFHPSADPRVNDWPMMSSPLPSLGLCLFYAYFSKVLGPRIMAGRQPFNLRKILIVYNFFQTIFSAWIFYEVRVLPSEMIHFNYQILRTRAVVAHHH